METDAAAEGSPATAEDASQQPPPVRRHRVDGCLIWVLIYAVVAVVTVVLMVGTESGWFDDDPPSYRLPPTRDLDCSDFNGPVYVGSYDPHGLDADNDGVGCE